jgi:ribose 5-phosphate isomerase B
MKIAIGSDHGGLSIKAAVLKALVAGGHEVVDMGTHTTDSVDYPDIAKVVADAVSAGEVTRGVLVCGTGLGMSIAANKVAGVRAAVVTDTFSAQMACEHNNANILCLGERVVGEGLALALLDAWMNAEFGGGRHARRVGKINALD